VESVHAAEVLEGGNCSFETAVVKCQTECWLIRCWIKELSTGDGDQINVV